MRRLARHRNHVVVFAALVLGALPQLAGPEPEPLIDVARINGQVKASSVKKVAEVVEQHPEESAAIIRGWLNNAV